MKRMLTMMVVLAVTSTALADIGPPPGFKRVPAEHKVTTEKEYPDYVFYKVLGDTATELKLDPKTPAIVTGTGLGPRRSGRLVAVPKGASKKFDSEKDFLEAVASGKVEGMLQSKEWFGGQAQVKESETRKVIVTEYKIEKIDPKEGIVFVGDKKDAPKSKCEESNAAPIGYTPKGGVWVAGLAGTFAVALAGLWIARRGRRDMA